MDITQTFKGVPGETGGTKWVMTLINPSNQNNHPPQPLEPKGGRGTLVVSSITFSSLFREAIATCDWEGAPKIWLDARVGAKPIHYSRPKCRVCRVPQ